MGFPVGYTELLFPKLLLITLSILGFIRRSIFALFKSLGLGDFLEPDIAWPAQPVCASPEPRSLSAILIRELLPVVKFSDLVDPPDSCAVCLYEFDGGEEIRQLPNCCHIFHRSCLDRWMDHDQQTCPLCRTRFVDDLMDGLNERLWAASGVSDFYYGEYSSISSETDIAWPAQPDCASPEPRSLSAILIRELLPVVKFSDLVDSPESCAVCLYEFDGDDEIRQLPNCCHIFHRSCLDRWMDHDQQTCLLCRTRFVADDLMDGLNERLWVASGVSDFYGEYSSISSGFL
ncbi:hypothetical protein Vadar_014756 [Vaccinium darrowii]|uniref:Uncharacterized protein n=1 Tax=Vaccinium darrowii TaxID=229202 RepID=A0ACB7ZBT7_9ERIC|nr:hypothetical protein Vadar_014756 [Vaccinium darrowii]